ncbi:MAG: hypothetical protein KC442_18690 [Thermomicrobiales bacterium]|nr:hypothetical protein [Thermomicrobiales bacterium]
MSTRYGASTAYSWKDFSRFVDVAPVRQGWLVLWGRYHDLGSRRELHGNRIYANLPGARRRVAEAVLELTHDPALVAEALTQFDRTPFSRAR